VKAPRAHLAQHARDALHLGHEVDGRADEVAEGRRLGLVVLEEAEEVFRVEQADDVVDLVAVDGKARVPLARHEAEHLGKRRRDLDGADARARDHDVAGDEVLQLEHVADHLCGLLSE
jgi:hypothetical protein